MNSSRSLVGLVDLTLILLGSVALIAELHHRDAMANTAIKREENLEQREVLTVPLARLFEPDEARLSPEGRGWVVKLAGRANGREVAIAVQPEDASLVGRLDAWEKAAARTGAIMYALDEAGHPDEKIDPGMSSDDADPSGVTISIGD